MNFEEFMWAVDKEMLGNEIAIHYKRFEPMPEALHFRAIELYKQYLITGGMPVVVAEFVESKSLITSSEIQGRILNEYIADMAKYANSATSVKISLLQFNSNTISQRKQKVSIQDHSKMRFSKPSW